MIDKYGLIGKKLGHSFSAQYFNNKFRELGIEAVYDNYEIPTIEYFREILNSNPTLKGLNVTIPYKREIIPFLDAVEEMANNIGAVNCIKITTDGKCIGYNTDIIGFQQSLEPLLNKEISYQALILGTGGAADAVEYVLQTLNIPYQLVSRTEKEDILSYERLTEDLINESLLIINTTPLGMYPNVDSKPNIPYKALTNNHILYDLTYNPAETAFLKEGIKKGAIVCNGLEMLKGQAEAGWKIWND